MTAHRTVSPRSYALLGVVAGTLTLAACGGGDPDGSSRADVMAARTERGRQAQAAARDGHKEPQAAYLAAAQATAAWVPQVSDTWQWQLSGTINTGYNVKVYDIDLFDAPDSVLTTLRNQGKAIVCYFSAGSAENWRPDYNLFKAADKGNNLDGWPGERWVDTRSANVRTIMKARLDKAKARGCDGVEPDNVDAYQNNPGFPLTATTQLDYNRFLATEAHARGLKVALKNDVDQLSALAPSFDFAVNEQCNEYSECGGYTAFTGAGKPVFNAEYKNKWKNDANARAQMCAKARAMNLRTLVLPLDLNDAFRYSCD
ncbi:MAG TPA: endo alpha-1,4 polygalactosaminidase [Ideonella sp.]|jgi:hypothetical protein|nr:endo alpha-1,4 polygalactosaminidase [Ideonella sp.]